MLHNQRKAGGTVPAPFTVEPGQTLVIHAAFLPSVRSLSLRTLQSTALPVVTAPECL